MSRNYNWAIPIMRAGYAGRAITYTAIAGLSLLAIWRGGQAQGTGGTLRDLAAQTWGVVVLCLIAVGLLAYGIWRGIDAAEDLEEYGTDAKGLISRAGMIVTGLIHAAIGAFALSLVLGRGSGGGEDGGGGGAIAQGVGAILEWPGGRFLVGFAALCTLGAGVYYVVKGAKSTYRKHLQANPFTRNADTALKAGVISNGIIILIIGGFLGAAALSGSEAEAGGMQQAFEWLRSQPFGRILVVAICVGLLAFAFFCAVNAAYRIVPKASDPDIESLGRALRA
ncbi:DUF1206 domain-containing protein [Jannaschia sp. LMIT008]|uniref:DUF1206 domain-containing protein n=1 Tax=Jannaschia maritima TaxID=3032585 RepID=UPI0028128132|nr:DUF1206 domain-containing protein [Jannaschia sp. LMIT008]